MRKLFLFVMTSIIFDKGNGLLAMNEEQVNQTLHKIVLHSPTWEFLTKGDTVEIIAPSSGPLTASHEHEVKKLIKEHDLEASLFEGTFNKESSRYGYYANSDEERANYFVKALEGNSKALWPLLGGFGAAEIVAILEQRGFLPPPRPKLIIGFSDITALHLLVATWGWPSLHGPVLGLGKEFYQETHEKVNSEAALGTILKILKGEVTHLEYTFEVIHPGAGYMDTPITGSVMGGNLSIIENHSGTKTALKGTDRFVFFEDTPEDGKRLNRRLVNLMRTGIFDEAKAIIVGHNPVEEHEDSLLATKGPMDDFVKHFLLPRKIDIPVVYSCRFGHGLYNDIMPLGTEASLRIQEQHAVLKVSVNESAYK
ncbi:MAG: LD-carboxypeptidase [Alphaproteobacteria bacterium]|nr:LD-carboxypeptidase [Alphaproteobacteria bacterium]